MAELIQAANSITRKFKAGDVITNSKSKLPDLAVVDYHTFLYGAQSYQSNRVIDFTYTLNGKQQVMQTDQDFWQVV